MDMWRLINGFRMRHDVPKGEKIADILYFVSQHRPKEAVPCPLIAKKIFGSLVAPRANDVQNKKIRGAMGEARKVMMRKYAQGLRAVRGEGFRATVDQDDLANTQLSSQVKRVEGAVKSVQGTLAITNVSEIRDRSLRVWVSSSVKPILGNTDTGRRLAALMPPKKGT